MRKPLAIAIIALLGSTAFAAGEVYRWKDANGIWNYSDQFHPGAELLSGKAATSNVATPAAQTPVPAIAATQVNDDALPVSKEVAQEVRLDAAAAKVKRCEKAKVDYDNMVKALRIKRKDEKGNDVFLNPAEADAARLQARATKDLACAP